MFLAVLCIRTRSLAGCSGSCCVLCSLMVQALIHDCGSEIAFSNIIVSAYSFQASQLITSVLFILGMELLQWVLPCLGPYLEPMGDCSVVSKSIRKASFQMWISQAIDQALRSMSQTDASYNSFQSVVRDTMTTHSAAMCYVFFQEYCRELTNEKRMRHHPRC